MQVCKGAPQQSLSSRNSTPVEQSRLSSHLRLVLHPCNLRAINLLSSPILSYQPRVLLLRVRFFFALIRLLRSQIFLAFPRRLLHTRD